MAVSLYKSNKIYRNILKHIYHNNINTVALGTVTVGTVGTHNTYTHGKSPLQLLYTDASATSYEGYIVWSMIL